MGGWGYNTLSKLRFSPPRGAQQQPTPGYCFRYFCFLLPGESSSPFSCQQWRCKSVHEAGKQTSSFTIS